ncbi:hypothetical protein CEP52_015576 [Fusarium oligoseptatum]|uniref:Succinate dehydrogenase assembly factor 4, mitochondrial n=1 Tax=Fusarium oligoseptatum TaxID=2604345 RepID=A0A428SBT0_9HYPO|nr:hypothetical protein CEP52_015576 [Fusarium oligoseptatum]
MSRLLTRRITPLLRLSTPPLSQPSNPVPVLPSCPLSSRPSSSVSSAQLPFLPPFSLWRSKLAQQHPLHRRLVMLRRLKKSEDVNQGLFRGAPPEFEGDTNPKTGEVGGPKNEPLRWGGEGDWSYNGRVTDF